jgi:diguanylate cyclase (GGDEF)-like protein
MSTEANQEKRILIGEDDALSRRLLEAFPLQWGYDVVTATNGVEALRILEEPNAPRLAVLDWIMPGLEGPEVCQQLRKDPVRPYTYVLLLTSRTHKKDILKGLDSGADDYLTKPFNAQELRARLHVGQRILNLQQNLIVAREELFFRATHDSLTGISNRGVALDALHREHTRQTREGGSFGIILADLDHFKYINDQYGHICGDAVLKEASRRMLSCCRAYDMVGRYGGEEFLIVAPASDAAGLLSFAERMRKALEGAPFPTEGKAIDVTGSFGIAVSTKDDRPEPQELLRLADDALYLAKARGRNRSEIAKSPVPAAELATVTT